MNTFVSAIDSSQDVASAYDATLTTTDNGAVTYKSTLNHCVDLFSKMGSARGVNLNAAFDKAMREDSDLTTRMVLWLRDVRGGAGERQSFRNLLNHMELHYKDELKKIIPKIAEVGRWDDLLFFKTPEFKKIGFDAFQVGLASGNALAGKWAPREKGSKKNNQLARELMEHMKMPPKQYRKLIVSLTNVVETQLCNKQYDMINFSHVPSVATRRYTAAFKKHASDAYEAYMTAVAAGDAKVNASAIFPHDVTTAVLSYDADQIKMAGLQWDALPNYTNGRRILAMVDLSGSMDSPVPGLNVSHKHMAITLGLYVAEKNTGAFKDVFIAFAEQPSLNKIKGTSLSDRYNSIKRSQVGYSTNFQAAFDLILQHAKNNNVPRNEMPEVIIVPSDMQFNHTENRGPQTNFQAVRDKFENAGYVMPELVFWQMDGSKTDSPVRADQSGVSLISGFSPSILKGVLSGVFQSPIETMLKTLMVARYDI